MLLMVDYTIKHSKRKTVGIYIKDGCVEVRAPLKCPKSEIESFVSSKAGWINDKLHESKKQAEKKKAFALNYGDTILYRGVTYPLTARAGTRAFFDGQCFYLPQGLKPALIKEICVKVYRQLAKVHLIDRVAKYSEQIGTSPVSVKINGAKSRWGSCSSRKSINFSWRLIMAEDSVIDYVVVHEMAHLIHMDHSYKFWAVVESVLPDYQERKSQLLNLQNRLATEDWG